MEATQAQSTTYMAIRVRRSTSSSLSFFLGGMLARTVLLACLRGGTWMDDLDEKEDSPPPVVDVCGWERG